MALVVVPRINANEDELQLVAVLVREGQEVVAGQVLCVVESTKAASDVVAPAAGIVTRLHGKVGDVLQVGAPLCEVADGTGPAKPAMRVTPAAADTVVVTAKARKLAVELEVDLSRVVPVAGRIGEAEVRSAARAVPPPAVPATDGRRAVIVGGGGYAACLIDALNGHGYDLVGCTDTIHPVGHHVCGGVQVIGGEELLPRLLADGIGMAFIGIGGAESSKDRRAAYERVSAMGFVLPPVVHRMASIGLGTHIGAGCHVLAGATIGPRCRIGVDVIINQGAIVCHDSVVGDHAHLTPGSILAGSVRIGAMSVIGMGATVLLKTSVGARCLVHNGAQVHSDVPDGTIVDRVGRRRAARDDRESPSAP